ncbi:uncharacterized protein LOC143571474 [Bidens hawaiensis]|uniref:uncharacterized protein LOC143571474 n=1 Tax=Bidens hawaiensis TaxID=980011 RepID=UPI00404A1A9F
MNCLSINLRGARVNGKGWVKGLKLSFVVSFLAIQESKIVNPSRWFLGQFWGKSAFNFAYVSAIGSAGGLICLWDPGIFSIVDVVKSRHCLIVAGYIPGCEHRLNMVNVHAPNDLAGRRGLWAEIIGYIRSMEGLWVLLGDFNEVHCPEERLNSEFYPSNAAYFNDFTHEADLREYSLNGRRFTYMSSKGDKLKLPGFVDYVKALVVAFIFRGQPIGKKRKLWVVAERKKKEVMVLDWKKTVETLEALAEEGLLSNAEMETRLNVMQSLKEAQRLKTIEAKQKSRVKWAVDGDENSKYFHGTVRMHTANNRIHGFLFEDGWISDPPVVKERALEFFPRRCLSEGCFSAFIALIPKKKDPMLISDYRPISLVGCINKVLSEVLVNRLKRVIGPLISEVQTAFLADRCILDTPLILNELILWMKRSRRKGMLFKVDIEKAYDSLCWGFSDEVMKQMNFPDRWRGWVMAIISMSKASILVNGSPTLEFVGSKGLRQGDPISPFLFIFAMEALTGFMKEACVLDVFKGIKVNGDGPLLSHLLYADDVIFCGEWSDSNARNLKRLLRCFFLLSGLRINLSKCSMFGVGVSEVEVRSLAGIMNCKAGKFPFVHLGVPIGANMNLYRNWVLVVTPHFRPRRVNHSCRDESLD